MRSSYATVFRMNTDHHEHEKLVESLNDEGCFHAYKTEYADYRPGFFPRILGALFVGAGNIVYGRTPSYLKFRSIEVIARVPYHSWTSALFTLLTVFYSDEKRALKLSTLSRFTTFAANNETMHVVVVSALAKKHCEAGIIRHSLVPMMFSFFYFWISYLLYLVSPRSSLELNYIFEHHAFSQYSEFIETYAEDLRREPIESEFLSWYGREVRSEYEFFRSVRNDELVHRNRSIHEIRLHS
jgi:ubiquinol oxidase